MQKGFARSRSARMNFSASLAENATSWWSSGSSDQDVGALGPARGHVVAADALVLLQKLAQAGGLKVSAKLLPAADPFVREAALRPVLAAAPRAVPLELEPVGVGDAAIGPAVLLIADVHVSAEVPLADVGRLVAGGLEDVAERGQVLAQGRVVRLDAVRVGVHPREVAGAATGCTGTRRCGGSRSAPLRGRGGPWPASWRAGSRTRRWCSRAAGRS